MLIFVNRSTVQFFRAIIIYCNQYFHLRQTNEELIQVHQRKFIGKQRFTALSDKEEQSIELLARRTLPLEPLISTTMTANVTITAFMIYMHTEPANNHLDWFASLQWYYIHVFFIIIMWTVWSYSVCLTVYYIFLYFILCIFILNVKYKHELKTLQRLAAVSLQDKFK